MIATARSYGRLAYEIEPSMGALLREVAAGHPVRAEERRVGEECGSGGAPYH